MNAKDLARDVVVLRYLKEQVAEAADKAAKAFHAVTEEGERQPAKLPDGTIIGSVTVAKGRLSASVVDEAALTEWVRDNRKGEIETVTVERIKPGYVQRLLAAAKRAGTAEDADGNPIPGITVRRGNPYLLPTTTDEEAIAAAWASGALPLPGANPPAIESKEDQ